MRIQQIIYVWTEGFGEEGKLFIFKIRTYKIFLKEINVIEVLYDHLSCF